MRKLLILLMLLSPLIITGCATSNAILYTFPPRPGRNEVKPVSSLSDIAEVMVYYEHLVQEWENWGNTVIKITGAEEK